MWVRGLKRFVAEVLVAYGKSHPMWVRGLKPTHTIASLLLWVAPHVGAWIETAKCIRMIDTLTVAPNVGAWIETYNNPLANLDFFGRAPCGCVD